MELKWRLHFFGDVSLRRILGYRCHDYMSNDLVLSETRLTQVTSLVRERQIRVYGHVARLLAEDSAHRILSCQDLSGWTMPRGRLTGFIFASGGVLSEGYGRGWPGVCLGDGQTEVVPSQGGRGDALLRRMPPCTRLEQRGITKKSKWCCEPFSIHEIFTFSPRCSPQVTP